MSIIEEWEIPSPPKFQVGDKVKLSEKAIKFFSRDNWTKYKVPYSMACGDYGFVVDVRKTDKVEFYVQNGSGTVYYHEDDLEFVENKPIELKINHFPGAIGYIPAKIKSNGGSSDYYKLTISNKKGESIEVETGDVIRSMVGNDFDFGNCIKALRRMYLATQGSGKEGINLQYDANKVKYFLDEIVSVHGDK